VYEVLKVREQLIFSKPQSVTGGFQRTFRLLAGAKKKWKERD
jgi:hypothetical protein